MYHWLDNTKIRESEILKRYFNELCTVETEPVKIIAVKSVTFQNKYGGLHFS